MLGNLHSLHVPLLALLDAVGLSTDGSRLTQDGVGVSLRELRRLGAGLDDVRWLMSKQYIRDISQSSAPLVHATEKRRRFRVSRKGVYVLTESGFALARDIAASNGLQSERCPSEAEIPVWKPEGRELLFAGLVVKRFKQRAPTQELILSVFDEENWPTHIDDPLPPQVDVVPAQRLHSAVRNLNRHQEHRLILFRSDGRSEGICWNPRPEGS